MIKSYDEEYLSLLQNRDTNERYNKLSIILADTYELTKQVIAYRLHYNSAYGGGDPIIIN